MSERGNERLREAPTWRPMWIMWAIGIPAMIAVDILTRGFWGGLCLVPYLALFVQTMAYRGKSR